MRRRKEYYAHPPIASSFCSHVVPVYVTSLDMTAFGEALCPPGLFAKLTASVFMPDVAAQMVHRKVMAMLPDMSSPAMSDLDAVAAFIARHRCSFFSTSPVMIDALTIGSVVFKPVPVHKLTLPTPYERDQLWAEALHMAQQQGVPITTIM